MPRTAITPHTLPTGLSTTPSTLTFTAADVANGNQVPSTGREILIVRNINAGAQTFTVTSAPIGGRTGHMSAISVAAGAFKYTQMFPINGWRQSDGQLWLDASHADITFAVLKV